MISKCDIFISVRQKQNQLTGVKQMIATMTKAKTFKLTDGSKSGSFYVACYYTVMGDLVKVQKYMHDSWNMLPSGWKKAEFMTIEAARAHYRSNLDQGFKV